MEDRMTVQLPPTVPPRKVVPALLLLLLFLLAVAAPSVQAQEDPLAGLATANVDEPEPEAAPTADLSEANDLVRKEEYAEAEALLAELQREFPEDPALLLMRGELLLSLQRADEALEVLSKSAELDPERPRTHFQLATARLAGGDVDGALEAFARECELSDDAQVLALARLNRSMLLQQQRKWTEAAVELKTILAMRAEDVETYRDLVPVEAYGDLASLYLQVGETDDAAAAVEDGRKAGFRSSPHYYSLGARLYSAKRFEESVAAFEMALEIDPRLARAERSLAAALEKLDRREEAVTHLQRYLELAPDADDAEQVAERIRTAQEG
jgi:tetratricopeptide (TPR) repeat protein